MCRNPGANSEIHATHRMAPQRPRFWLVRRTLRRRVSGSGRIRSLGTGAQGSAIGSERSKGWKPSENRSVRGRCTPDCAGCTVDCALGRGNRRSGSQSPSLSSMSTLTCDRAASWPCGRRRRRRPAGPAEGGSRADDGTAGTRSWGWTDHLIEWRASSEGAPHPRASRTLSFAAEVAGGADPRCVRLSEGAGEPPSPYSFQQGDMRWIATWPA
jgi:hypothetical protein